MVHTSYGEVGDFEPANLGDNGCVFKNVTFLGKSAHAGFAPDRGINALYAANLAMNAINALRETFREADYIRTHPIITGGGSVVNAIPSVVTVENQVRASNMESLVATNEKINRAMAGAAAAMGAQLKITDRTGYAPLHTDLRMSQLFCDAAGMPDPEHPIAPNPVWSTGCTDMGDISCLMPAIHPYCRGAAGPAHSDDYRIASVEKAGLPRLVPHCCRHTFSTLLKDVEGNKLDKMRIVGHSDEKTSNHYTHSQLAELSKITDQLR